MSLTAMPALDMVAMFNDTPGARALMQFLAWPKTPENWVAELASCRPTGGSARMCIRMS